MTLYQAARLREEADEWPRASEGWPLDREERQADEMLREAFGQNYARRLLNGEE